MGLIPGTTDGLKLSQKWSLGRQEWAFEAKKYLEEGFGVTPDVIWEILPGIRGTLESRGYTLDLLKASTLSIILDQAESSRRGIHQACTLGVAGLWRSMPNLPLAFALWRHGRLQGTEGLAEDLPEDLRLQLNFYSWLKNLAMSKCSFLSPIRQTQVGDPFVLLVFLSVWRGSIKEIANGNLLSLRFKHSFWFQIPRAFWPISKVEMYSLSKRVTATLRQLVK